MAAEVETLTVSQTLLVSIDTRLRRLENILRQVAVHAQDTAETVEEIQDTLDMITGTDDE